MCFTMSMHNKFQHQQNGGYDQQKAGKSTTKPRQVHLNF
jgi:hypothetical protein